MGKRLVGKPMFRTPLLVVVLLGVGPSALALEFERRTWTNDAGEEIEATLVGVSASTAYLMLDGRRVPAPINRLSYADREYLNAARQLNRRREWTLPDDSTRRGVLEEIGDGRLLISGGGGRTLEIALAELVDEDRELIAEVFPNTDFTARPPVVVETPAGDGVFDGGKRSWTDINGKVIEAEMRGVEGDKVVLFMKGREYRVPLARLSQADRDYVARTQQPGETMVADSAPRPRATPRPAPPSPAPGTSRRFPGGPTQPPTSGGDGADRWLRESERRHEEMFAQMERDRKERSEREQERERERAQRRQELDQRRRDRIDSIAGHDPGDSTRSSFRPPSNPTGPSGMAPGIEWVNEYECFSCNHKWQSKREYHAGDRCPKCGVRFDYMTGEDGEVVEETSSNKARRYAGFAKLGIFVVIAVLGILGRALKS